MTGPFELANEFAAVTVQRVETRNGVRLRLSSARLGRSIDLDPVELESLTWQSHDLFSGFLATPFGPDDDADADVDADAGAGAGE